MGIINITQIIKASGNITVPAVTGKIQRVVNTSEEDILATGDGSGNSMVIVPGRFLDFYFDGTEWLVESESVANEMTGTLVRTMIEAGSWWWGWVDPVNLPSMFQVMDGSVWKTGSYAKQYWEDFGITNIPDQLGYHVRALDFNKGNDPDRADRRTPVTGDVSTTSGVVISLSRYNINRIKSAKDNGETVVIGEMPATIFGSPGISSTVDTINTEINTVTLSSDPGFSAGTAVPLVIQGDIVGSFQNDAFQGHMFWVAKVGSYSSLAQSSGIQRALITYSSYGSDNEYRLAYNSSYTTPDTLQSGYPVEAGSLYGAPRYTYESRGKNTAYLPIMLVHYEAL